MLASDTDLRLWSSRLLALGPPSVVQSHCQTGTVEMVEGDLEGNLGQILQSVRIVVL